MKKKKPHLILKSFTLIFAVYAAFNFFSLQVKISNKQAEIDAMNEKIYEQQVANQQLRESANKELSNEEIADIARQKLEYALPGERVFYDITGK